MIWVVGNKGMLGTELGEVFSANGFVWVGTDRELSILDANAVSAFAESRSIDWIVNCAAYTAVDKAEDEESIALKLNADGPENLARLAKKIGARLLHVSTDYVFDGTADRPYLEADPIAPLGAYGRTKAEGERRVLAISDDSVIIRTAWLYGKHGPNFVHTMLRLMKEKDAIGVVADQYGSPTWTRDLANAIALIVRTPSKFAGIYHFTDEGKTSWHSFATEIFKLGRACGILATDCAIHALTTDQYPTKVERPAYSVLSKEKIRTAGAVVPDWKDSLADFIALLDNEKQ